MGHSEAREGHTSTHTHTSRLAEGRWGHTAACPAGSSAATATAQCSPARHPPSLHAALLGTQQPAGAGHDGLVPAEHVGVYCKAVARQHVV